MDKSRQTSSPDQAAEIERRYTVVVLRPGTREVMAHHKLNAEVTPGLQFDPEWWGQHPPTGLRLIQVMRCLDKAEWPESERDGADHNQKFVVETKWV